MDRFFSKLQPDKLMLRNNYFFQVVDTDRPVPNTSSSPNVDPKELSWARTALGDEGLPPSIEHSIGWPDPAQSPPDLFIHGHHETTTTENEKKKESFTLRPEYIYFRSERQSLRRLPQTGAILFTIRTYYEPVTSLAQESGVPGRMASALRSWPEDVAV